MSTTVRRPVPSREAAFVLRETKLAPPRARPGVVPRAALLHRLCTSGERAVVVTAPPGYGKTTLLSEWEACDDRRFAWFSADVSDNHPVTLLRYLAVAVDRAGGDCSNVLSELAAGSPLAACTSLLRRSLQSLETPIVVVVDNAHRLGSPATRKLLVGILDALGPGSQLVLSGRRRPPNWARSRDDVLDLGMDELRLGVDEARSLLHAAGIELTEAEVDDLTRRVEGWPAGLYLAALSLDAQRTRGETHSGFDGADRLVSDYLELEVLSELATGELALLGRAAVVDRVCGPLADAMLGRSGSSGELDSLAAATRFVIPIEPGCSSSERRRCYRLHPMLRDALASNLERDSPDLPAELNRGASRFYEAELSQHAGDEFRLDSAIRYAHAAGDRERLISLIEASEPRPYGAERLAAYEGWLAQFDDTDAAAAHPKLAMFSARVHALSGRAEAAERSALAAEHALRPGGRAGDAPPAPSVLAAQAWLCRDGVEAMRANAERAAGLGEQGDSWHATAVLALGVAELLAGNPVRADELFEDAVAAAAAAGTPDERSVALAERSLLAADARDWPAADALARDARDTVLEAGLEDYVASALVHAATARVAVQAGNLQCADEALERARQLLPRLTSALPWLSAQVRLELAHVQLALSRHVEAAARLAELADLLERRPLLGTIAARVTRLERRLASARKPGSGWPASLTTAERRLLPLLGTHLTFREIAVDLGISRNTVKTQAISVYRKLRVSSRAEAVEAAFQLGLLSSAR